MNTPGLLKCAGAVVVLVIVSACGSALRQPFDGVYPERSRGAQGDKAGGDMTVAPSATTVNATDVGRTLFVNGRPITAARLNPLPRYAELVPDKSKSKNYEYIFNYYDTYASIFDYPKSVQQIGTINGAGGQGCTNVLYGYGKKLFWNAGRTNDLIYEYRVPKKLIKTRSLNYTYTSSCAMNTSGDIAVGVLLARGISRCRRRSKDRARPNEGVPPIRSSFLRRCALSACATTAILAGCGGSQPPIGAPTRGSVPSIASAATPVAIRRSASRPDDNTSILKKLTKDVIIGSTVDSSNGDMGPRALSIVGTTYGLRKGQLLVCNFVDSSGKAGKGTTIELLNPTVGTSPKRFAQSSDIKGCDADALTSGNQVYAAGISGSGLVVFSPTGKRVGTIGPIQSPFADGYARAGRYSPEDIFTSDGLGDIIGFSFGVYGTGEISQVASGFADNGKTGWAALGASGIQDDPKRNALYIVDGVDNTVVEFTNATDLGVKNEIVVEKGGKKFKCLYPNTTCGKLIYSGAPLDAPEAAAILPNGNLIVANTAGGNTLVELTPAGKVLDTKVVDKNRTQGIFGLVARGSNDNNTVLFFSDTNGDNVQELKH